jgi:TolB-like protein
MAGVKGVENSSEIERRGAFASVFVSYASQDLAIANAVVASLEQDATRCWIAPRDVTPGSQYADEIVTAINNTRIFVLILSEHSSGSAHVGRELERAASKRRRILVLRTDAASLTRSFEYFLSESQWIDVSALGLQAALTKLTQAAGQHLSPSSWVSPGLGRDVQNPSGIKRRLSHLTLRRALAAAIFLVAAAVVVAVMTRYWPSKQTVSQAPAVQAVLDKSIAVLPFADMSEKKDQEYFADGMSEEIINLLVKIPGLKVIGRTSSFQFKGRTDDLRSIGEKLGASYVLEGSVRKSGDRLRVTAQLVSARDGTQLLSRSYDRDMSDVLQMQDAIAVQVVRALEIEVSAADFASRPVLRNTEAYTAYLKGSHALNQFDQQGLEQAVNDFQRAIDLDPSFADARVWLAITYLSLGGFGFIPAGVAQDRARQCAESAIKLDPNLARAHSILGVIYLDSGNWSAADQELQTARRLTPNEFGILVLDGSRAMTMGDWDDALKMANARLERDPLDPLSYAFLSSVQLRRGRLVEAESAARRVLEISPTFGFAHYQLGVILLARGGPQPALEEFAKDSIEATRLKGSAMAYSALGRRRESDLAAAQLLKSPVARSVPFSLAELSAYRNQHDEAFRWLDIAYVQKDANLVNVKSSTLLDNLHEDSRYKSFLQKMKLPE